MRMRGVSLTVLLLLVSACGPAAVPSATDATPPLTSTGPAPTATIPAKPTLTPPPTLPPPTSPPTATSTPKPSPTSSLPPTATAEPDIAATFAAIAPPTQMGEYASPDGRRVVQLFRHDCTLLPSADGEAYEQAYEMLRYVDAGARVHEFATQHQACGGLGAAGLQGYFWSADGRYFYYGTAREGVADGCGYFAPPYYRLDTADRTTTYLGYGPLSPDGTMLALWGPQGELVVYTVAGEQLVRIVPDGPERIANTIAWSPDGGSLVYVLTSDYCPEGSSTLTRLNLSDLQPILLRQDDPGYANVSWLSGDTLRLDTVLGDSSLTVDAVTGESHPVTI